MPSQTDSLHLRNRGPNEGIRGIGLHLGSRLHPPYYNAPGARAASGGTSVSGMASFL